MSERRYSDDDVQRILANAAEVDATIETVDTGSGMTLAEIQSVAAEAGLSSASVSAAAGALDVTLRAPETPRLLGMPIAVARTVAITGMIDDVAWPRLVAFLRDTFGAQGREQIVGGRREWRNGNLRIAIEVENGTTLLHMRTRKESARALIRVGGAMVLGAAIVGVAGLFMHSGNPLAGAVAIALGGIATGSIGALQLPSWSAGRAKQFESVAEYVRQLTALKEPALPR